MRNNYETLPVRPDQTDILDWIRQVTRERLSDLEDYEQQQAANPRIYSAPTSSSDTIGTEKVGDIAADTSYLYVVVDNSGTLEWRRVAISTF